MTDTELARMSDATRVAEGIKRGVGPGEGATSSWGEITNSRLGSATDRR